MGASEKFEAGVDKMKGKAKETAGHTTDDPKLVAEGKIDQAKGTAKKAAEDVKDAVRK